MASGRLLYCKNEKITLYTSLHVGFLLISFIGLTILFLLDDFTTNYVLRNSNSLLPWWYKISAVWGAHEGSILLWIVILSVWIFFAVLTSRQFDQSWRRALVSVLALTALGLGSFVVFTSNPFVRDFFPYSEGNDLNPLLQDPGLIFHPPLLYLGYIGMAIPYGFTVAMLLVGRIAKQEELVWLRKWVLLSFAFLSLGIALGSFWAYYELGWGGWWFWDPVENASLMPWLISVGLIHAISAAIKRKAMIQWVYFLSLLGFIFSVLGTFLVRSGIIISVHSFASDPSRGIYILMLLSALSIPALTLFSYRFSSYKEEAYYEWFSREGLIKINNCIFISLLFVTALGTLYPLILEILNLSKISVGPPFFNKVFIPLALPLYLIMVLAPVTKWGSDSIPEVLSKLKLSAICAIIALLLLYVSTKHLYFSFLSALAVLTIIHIFATVINRKIKLKTDWFSFFKNQSMRWYGMNLAHLGAVIFLIGAMTTSVWQQTSEDWMKLNEAKNIGSYRLKLLNISHADKPSYTADQALFQISDSDGNTLKELTGEKRFYKIRNQETTETAIYATMGGDIFLALGAVAQDRQSAQIRIQYKPLIRLTWLGFILFALGGLIAVLNAEKNKNKLKKINRKLK